MRSDQSKPRAAADTERQRARRVCRKHLEDLRRAHKHPPEDVRVKSVAVPKFLEPAAPSSYQSSPSQLCSELGE